MAVAAALARIQEEATCPICLDVLLEPITLECGHHFCHGCVQRVWPEEPLELFPCPFCRQLCQRSRCVRNAQLGRIVAQTMLLREKRKQPAQGALCGKHARPLCLFCQLHPALLCVCCAQLPEHRGHPVRPVQEAASEHRQQLRGYTDALRERVAEAQRSLHLQDRKAAEMREQMVQERHQLAREYEELDLALHRAQEAATLRLAEEKQSLLQRFKSNISALLDHRRALRALRAEVVERSVQASGARMLQGIKAVASRCQALRAPELCPLEGTQQQWRGSLLPAQHSELRKIITTFAEDVRLDPLTAHPSLRVARDGTSVTFVGRALSGPRKLSGTPRVLGAPAFRRGRHYWEVQVCDKALWAVGVWQGSSEHWTVWRRGGQYVARDAVAAVPLELVGRPRGIGVYLDWELDLVSFYKLPGRLHIYTFQAKFSHAVKPYFCVGPDAAPLILGSAAEESEA